MEAAYQPLFRRAAGPDMTAQGVIIKRLGLCLVSSTFLALIFLAIQYQGDLALRASHLYSSFNNSIVAITIEQEQLGSTGQDADIRLFIPSFDGHVEEFFHFMKSLTCLCTDIDEIPISVILSNQAEVELFRGRLDIEEPCGSKFLNYDTSHVANNTSPKLLTLENLYDILPAALSNLTGLNHTTHDTVGLMNPHTKYKYQTIKKMAAATYHDYDFALWMDSEGFAIRPFSMRDTVMAYYRDPVIWKSTMTDERQTELMWEIMDASAYMVGRKMDDFGRRYWNVESYMWPIEKAVINDLLSLRLVSAPHQGFWERLLISSGWTFEIGVYNLFIHMMKEDTVRHPVYEKYRILQVEREMEKFNLTTALEQVSRMPSGGILERFYLLLCEPGALSDVVEFSNSNHLFFQRMDDRNFTDKETVMRFLREASIAMILSSNPGIDDWIAEAQLDVLEGSWARLNATS